MKKLPCRSPNFTNKNISKILKMFPNCETETKDKNGNLIPAIDFELLKQELTDNIVDGSEERYRLDWPGKRQSLIDANTPITKTLRPVRKQSKNFDTTENLFIEGDNLEALKLLQNTYLNQVKMIYIDPPYNTGKDFIYKDNFAQKSDDWKQQSGDYDEEGNRLVQNTESNGRFHSDWLSMMYPRLKLARNLLKDDGVIFISIDDNEVSNLKKLCDEIFGEDNFFRILAVELTKTQGMKVKAAQEGSIVKNYEFILCYVKNKINLNKVNVILFDKGELFDIHYNSVIVNCKKTPLCDYIIQNKEIYNELATLNMLTNNKLQMKNIEKAILISDKFRKYIYKDISKIIYQETACNISLPKNIDKTVKYDNIIKYEKYLLTRSKGGKIRQYIDLHKSLAYDDGYNPEYGRVTIRGDLWKGFYSDMMNVAKEGKVEFKNGKKPIRLIKQLSKWFVEKHDIIMDFFSGSATTAHAVMQLNAEDGGKRKFIMVQLPEECDKESEAFKDNCKTIADIGKKRIRRAGEKINKDNPNIDTGFRVLKIADSNMLDIYYTPNKLTQGALFKATDNIKPERSNEDLLFHVLLDWGIDLTYFIEKQTIAGIEVFFVDKNSLVACFAKAGEINDDFCKQLATRQPLRVVFRDAGFADNDVKINATQIFKQLSPNTEIRTI